MTKRSMPPPFHANLFAPAAARCCCHDIGGFVIANIIGGLLLGCTRSVASKFTFFLAIPVMFGASALKLVKYFIKGGTFGANEVAILGVGCVVAFVVSLIAIKWLMGFVRRHDFKCFGVYRIILGVVVLAYFFVLEPMLGL